MSSESQFAVVSAERAWLMAARVWASKRSSLKAGVIRHRWTLEEMVDFMAARMLAPSAVEQEMAQRIASRHARLLNEFGYFSAERRLTHRSTVDAPTY